MDLSQKEWTENLLKGLNTVVLDVRTADEFADGKIENAINIDIYRGQGFIYEADALDKTKSYYIYCKAGGRSAQACSIMKDLGFEKTYNLVGGIMNWKGAIIK